MEYSTEATIRLVAEDLRAARARLGITLAQAANRAGVAAARYRALEKGRVPSNQDILRKLVSVCRRLDMESVRVAYVEEIGQYAHLDLSREAWRESPTVFLEVVEADVTELQDIECFISPGAVFGYLERIGFGATLVSRKPEDKQMVELLAGAVLINDVTRRGQRLLCQACEGRPTRRGGPGGRAEQPRDLDDEIGDSAGWEVLEERVRGDRARSSQKATSGGLSSWS